MTNDKGRSSDYRIEETREGQSGYVFYIEGASKLPFFWEIIGIPSGVGITVPKHEEWEAFCDKHKAEWAKDRRDEILQSVSQWMLKKWFRSGEIEFEGPWIRIIPGPSLISRLLSRIGY